MKKPIFSAVFLLGIARCANAAAQTLITDVTGSIPASDLSYTRSVYQDNPSLDVIEIHYQDWLGPADPKFGNATLQGMEGSWSLQLQELQFI